MLTAKQEKFVQNIIEGMSQRKAYIHAGYSTKNMKESTIDEKACLLFKNDKIRTRYNELIEKAQNKAIMTAKERKELLTRISRGEEKEKIPKFIDGELIEIEVTPQLKRRISAIETLNKMDGVYVQRLEIEASINANVVKDIEDFIELKGIK